MERCLGWEPGAWNAAGSPEGLGCSRWGSAAGAAEAERNASEIMPNHAWKNQQGGTAKGGNRGLLTAASREPYIVLFDFPPGSTRV